MPTRQAKKIKISIPGFANLLLNGELYPPPPSIVYSKRPPIIFWHGGGQTLHSWKNTCSILNRHGYCVLNMDLRGHGDSEWSQRGYYRLWHFGEDVIKTGLYIQNYMKDNFNLQVKPVVVGASMGGLASIFATGTPQGQSLFSGLCLVDIAAKLEPQGVDRIVGFMKAFDGFSSLDHAAEEVAKYMNREKPQDYSGLKKNLRWDEEKNLWRWHWDPSFLNHGVNQTDRMQSLGKSTHEINSHDVRFSDKEYADDSLDSREQVLESHAKNIVCPVHIVRGRSSDVLSTEGIQHFCELVPQTSWIDIQAHHMVAGDDNDSFTNAVLDWLSTLQGPFNKL